MKYLSLIALTILILPPGAWALDAAKITQYEGSFATLMGTEDPKALQALEDQLAPTLATADALISVPSAFLILTLSGQISGSVGVNKTGLGGLIYQYVAGDNTYTGTTLVSGGTLQLNVGGTNAFSYAPGPGAATYAPFAKITGPDQKTRELQFNIKFTF